MLKSPYLRPATTLALTFVAYLMNISIVVRVGIVLITLSLCIAVIYQDIYRSDRKYRKPITIALVTILSIIALFVLWWDFDRSRRVEVPYKIGIRSAVIYDAPGELSFFMIGYPSMFGDTASPVFYLLNISITNLKDIPSTVEGYTASVSDKENGPWRDLMPIALEGTNLYALGIDTTGRGTLKIPKGVYILPTPMTQKDMTSVALMDASPKLDAKLKQQIQPRQTIGGWAAFDFKNQGDRGVWDYVRIKLRDSAGMSFSEVIAIPRRMPGDPESDIHPGMMVKVGQIIDISSFHVRYYSDPYPRLKNSK